MIKALRGKSIIICYIWYFFDLFLKNVINRGTDKVFLTVFVRIVYISGKNPPWLTTACSDYCLRTRSPWTIEQKHLPISKKHASDKSKAICEESDNLLKASNNRYRIALSSSGKSFDSRTFAHWLDSVSSNNSSIAFLIGGPSGFDQRVLCGSDASLSLSSMTWPHALCRLMLCEQIYRASTIVHGGNYHK